MKDKSRQNQAQADDSTTIKTNIGLAYHEMIQSKTFSFLLGPEEKEITVHSGPISKISKPLAKLMKGEMKEARQCTAKIADFDAEVFLRFCEFAFTENYTPIKAKKVRVSESQDSDGEDGDIDKLPSLNQLSKGRIPIGSYGARKTVGRGLEQLCLDFVNREFSCSPHPSLMKKQSTRHDYEGVLKMHANLYIMGDRYDVEELQQLALFKLHNLLCQIKPTNLFIANFLSLAEFAFSNENTRDTDPDEPMDELRDLLLDYIACTFPYFVGNVDFEVFLEHQGVLTEVMKQVSKTYGL